MKTEDYKEQIRHPVHWLDVWNNRKALVWNFLSKSWLMNEEKSNDVNLLPASFLCHVLKAYTTEQHLKGIKMKKVDGEQEQWVNEDKKTSWELWLNDFNKNSWHTLLIHIQVLVSRGLTQDSHCFELCKIKKP